MVTIKSELLEAAFLFLNAKDNRHYLRGLHVDGFNLVALDGHRMFIANLDKDAQIRVTIPYDTIKSAMHLIKKSKECVLKCNEGAYSLEAMGNVFPFIPVDGEYPAYKSIVPTEIKNQSPATFNPKYYADIGKAAKILAGSDTGFHIFQSQTEPCGVKFKDRDDCIAVLMPLREQYKYTW